MRALDANDPFDQAAMLEVDRLAPAVDPITPPQVINRERERARAEYEGRRNAIVTGILGPGWYYREYSSQFVGRDGTLLDRIVIDRLM